MPTLKTKTLPLRPRTCSDCTAVPPTQMPGLNDKELRSQVTRTVADEEDGFCSKEGVMIKKPSWLALLQFEQAEWKHLGHIGTLPSLFRGRCVTLCRTNAQESLRQLRPIHVYYPPHKGTTGRHRSKELVSFKKAFSSFLCWYMWWWNGSFWSSQCWKLSLKMCKAFSLK